MTPMDADLRDRLRKLPGVDAVLAALPEGGPVPGPTVVRLARQVVDEAREAIRGRPDDPAYDPQSLTARDLAVRVAERYRALAEPAPRRVLNATGVLIHTNIGRSPLSAAAVAHLAEVAGGYSDLEYDLSGGRRGSRHDHAGALLRLLTGAEDALVVNNNAAAVLLALSAVAGGREVVLSRGEMVEIGGSFRIPEILAQSGARLREVGTTNRTHLKDYEQALGPDTGMLLQVHASNYRIEGFTHAVDLPDLVALGARHGVPVVVDLGSGALVDVAAAGIRPEPLVPDVVAQGPDLVTFSGDKLLGGPQAGIVVGKREMVAKLKASPLARAVRIDKLLLAALQSTLAAYLQVDRARQEIPVLRMLMEDSAEVRRRANDLARALAHSMDPAPSVMVESAVAAVGGGTLPQEGVASWVVAVDPHPHTTAARLERALRRVRPAVLSRVQEDKLLLDLRTLTVEEEGLLPDLVRQAWATAVKQGA